MSRRIQQTAGRPANRQGSLASGSRIARTQSNAMHPPGTPRRATTAGPNSVKLASETSETNINVVVRCRGRSQKEIDEATPVITSTSGPLTKNITVETTPVAAHAAASTFTTASSYNNGGGNTKTYPFDKVFGPEADQTMIFGEVAENMLDEVLAGYNCTIFAYGQTGTGKTYTMAGDCEPTPLMEPSTEAGIIPRVLHRLFALLNAQENSEYSVRASYVELYNEELRDLLAPEYKEYTGGSNIKIFDDAAKKGVIIQGLEEAGVPDVKGGLALLNKGTQRRQTAETKMNITSSRSHSIFTLTVAVKESSADKGEDLLRIGKFNLVDLAGSEAIGRSGAENKRAREAGMINQSLLTLGRVISALVDKSHHVPYRESKLTRLLQDSLGGRTKTCIIATVSPTRSNMEETISTLDYALRAKSIKNKPEVNSHMTKAGLLKEYLTEIERLKADLFATREKNGIWMDPDHYKDLQRNQQKQKSDYDEALSRYTAIEVELKTRKAEFEKLTDRFVKTDAELKQTRAAEQQLSGLLEKAKADVDKAQYDLAQERVVSEAYQRGEERLNVVAGELRAVAMDGVNDVGGLHEKVNRMASVLGVNSESSARFGSDMRSLFQVLQSDLSQLHSVQSEFGNTIRSDMESYAQRGAEESQRHLADLNSSFKAFDTLATSLLNSTEQGAAQAVDRASAILAVKAEVLCAVRSQAKAETERFNEMGNALLAQQQKHLSTVGNVIDSTANVVDAVFTAARTLSTAQNETLQSAKQQSNSAAEAEIARLRAQNQQLTQLLIDKDAETARIREDLISGVTNLIVGATDAQNSSLRSAVGKIQAGNDAGLRETQAFKVSQSAVIDKGVASMESFGREITTQKDTFEGQRGNGQRTLAVAEQDMRSSLMEYASESGDQARIHVESVDGFCGLITDQAEGLQANLNEKAQEQSDTIASLRTNSRDNFELSSQRVRAGADEIATLTSTLLDSHATSSEASAEAHRSAKRKIDEISGATDDFLGSLREDEPTGATPRKRTWDIPSWERTEPREALLNGSRRQTSLTVSVNTSPLKRVISISEDDMLDPNTSVATAVSVGSTASAPSGRSFPSKRAARRAPTSPAVRPLLAKMNSLPLSRTSSNQSSSSNEDVPLVNSMNGKRPKARRLDSHEARPQLPVLGEGGNNIPRRRQR